MNNEKFLPNRVHFRFICNYQNRFISRKVVCQFLNTGDFSVLMNGVFRSSSVNNTFLELRLRNALFFSVIDLNKCRERFLESLKETRFRDLKKGFSMTCKISPCYYFYGYSRAKSGLVLLLVRESEHVYNQAFYKHYVAFSKWSLQGFH